MYAFVTRKSCTATATMAEAGAEAWADQPPQATVLSMEEGAPPLTSPGGGSLRANARKRANDRVVRNPNGSGGSSSKRKRR